MKIGVIILIVCGLSSIVYCQDLVADCYTNRHISICPSNIVVKQGQTTTFLVRCNDKTIPGTFASTEIKKVQKPNNVILCRLKKIAGEFKAMYDDTVGDDFKKRTKIYANATVLSLYFETASYVDFTSVFICSMTHIINKKQDSCEDTAAPRAILHPSGTSLTISPVKKLYSGTDKVSLECTTYVGFSSLIPTKSKILFQKLVQGQWRSIPKTELAGEPRTGVEHTKGDFIQRTDTVKLTLASSRDRFQNFRCVVGFGAIIFSDNADQLRINVTVSNSSDNSSWGMKLTVITSIAVLIACLIIASLVTFFVRRNQKKKQEPNQAHEQKTVGESLPQTAVVDDTVQPKEEKQGNIEQPGEEKPEDVGQPEGEKEVAIAPAAEATPESSSSSDDDEPTDA